jgi:hypothetical protein
MEIDIGHSHLIEIVAELADRDLPAPNEATTRKLIIDRIIEYVLGWVPVQDVSYEERTSEDNQTTFADYVVTTATTSIVIEAKKEGQAFRLPIDQTTAKLGGVISEGEVGEAIRQARDYARKLSIPYAVVTNGISWIVFPAIRTDRVPFDKSRAILFRSMVDIRERFVEFWELLSRKRVIEGSLDSFFFPPEQEPISRRLVSMLRDTAYRIGRNRVYEHIEPAITAALSDESLIEDTDALENCYVKSTERVKFDSRIRMHLQDVKPALDRPATRPRSGGDPEVLGKVLSAYRKNPQRFILVLGSVGAGKTTFLEYTRKVSAKSLIHNKVIWFRVDFKKATTADNPREYILRELLNLIDTDTSFHLNNWEQSIRPAYHDFIESRKTGTLATIFRSDKQRFEEYVAEAIEREKTEITPFVERIIRYASTKYPVYIVIDNPDQIDSEQYQQTVFLEAQAIARRTSSNVILTLRDATYLRHRKTPVFDAFLVESIYIDPPAVRPVLSRRFLYAKRVLSGVPADIHAESGIRFSVKDLSVFFEMVSKSILRDPTGYMIEVLAESNVRRGLELVRDFLSSGHTSADHALKSYVSDGNYIFPQHEVFKGALLGQWKYYREEIAQIPNLFDAKLVSSAFQLLRYQILCRLVSSASNSSYEGDSVDRIISDLYRLGVHEQSILKVLNDLVDFRLIQPIDRLPVSQRSIVYPTRLGGYLCRDLSAKFMYFEPCLLDTNIHSQETWEELSSITNAIEVARWEDKMGLRIKRIHCFVEYLSALEEKWIGSCNRYNLQSQWGTQVIADLSERLKEELVNVSVSAEKTAKRISERNSQYQ